MLLDEDGCCDGTFCHEQSNCTKTFANFTCTCNDGHSGNGTFCEGVLTTSLYYDFIRIISCLLLYVCHRDVKSCKKEI